MMKKVLGLATCFNRREKTVNAIRTLIEGNPRIAFSFIIADDNSKDGTKEALQKFPQVTVVDGNGSLFYSGGMRLAISQAKQSKEEYDYCLLFNDDVVFYEGAIEGLTNRKENTVWVGPTCDEKGELSYGGVIKVSRWRPKTQIIKGETVEGALCDTCNANCVLIPWRIFRELDNIDPNYRHSMGDFDYGFEIVRKGYEMRVSDQYIGQCCDNPVQGSWRDTTLPRKKRLELKESPKGLPGKEWFYYLKRNYGLFVAVIYSLIPYGKILFGK